MNQTRGEWEAKKSGVEWEGKWERRIDILIYFFLVLHGWEWIKLATLILFRFGTNPTKMAAMRPQTYAMLCFKWCTILRPDSVGTWCHWHDNGVTANVKRWQVFWYVTVTIVSVVFLSLSICHLQHPRKKTKGLDHFSRSMVCHHCTFARSILIKILAFSYDWQSHSAQWPIQTCTHTHCFRLIVQSI